MSKNIQKITFPGFTAISERIFVRGGEELNGTALNPSHPHTVVVYGWGDAPPKHVAKFTDGYRQLYPQAKQIAVLSPIYKGFFDPLSQRTEEMMPLVNEVFPKNVEQDGSVLCHILSNSGAINYSATLNAYKELYNKPMPHTLTVYDSTPGTPNLNWPNLKRWSNAMAIGAAPKLPLPFFVTRTLCGIFFCYIYLSDYLVGKESAPWFSHRIFFNEEWESKQSLRLFIYGKDDIIIPWEHVEGFIAESRKNGYPTEGELFESGHVGHMRKNPDKYWKTIQGTWDKAVQNF
ncbi:Transmembrane protein 53-B [Fusarium austroafricanum]|uniref:Transmembrane protein 53-B n=1 Tax=Fusarium austroafricanum TaxID=2364996 RepID=A0A8H4KF19_9HYPO|nr:Transmembrane protein 53-B [Fusarium austroafricanum]